MICYDEIAPWDNYTMAPVDENCDDVLCPENCLTCYHLPGSDELECTVPSPGYVITESGIEFSSCQTLTQYPDEEGHCVDCPEECNRCDENGCLTCPETTILLESEDGSKTCVDECPIGT